MHIGIHCYEYPPCKHGGVGSFTKDLAEALVKKGHQVTIFGFYYDFVLKLDNSVDEQINGVRVIRVPEYKKFKNKRLNVLISRLKLYKLIKKINKEEPFDIIESPEASGWLPLGVPDKITFVTRLHGGQKYFGKEIKRKTSFLISLLEKMQLKKTDYTLAVSKYVGTVTFNLFNLNKNFKVIYNSVDSFFSKLEPIEVQNEKTILFYGSVIPKKGVEELIKSMNYVMNQDSTVKLLLAGKNNYRKDGQHYEDYLRAILNKEYNNRVQFLGSINRETELIPLIQKATICCFPSHSEAFALAPLEAMAIGKAIVNTNLASGSELLIDNESGLLCNPKNPKDISEKLLQLLNNSELLKSLGINAKKRILENFNFENWVNKNEEFYLSIRDNK